MMNKKSVVVLILTLVNNSGFAVVSSGAMETKTNADKFQDYFYESLTQKESKLR
jgi:hypothetical protein